MEKVRPSGDSAISPEGNATDPKTAKPRILHICNWYPNVDKPSEAPFIRRHIDALKPYYDQHVWHIEVRSSKDHWGWVRKSLLADRTYRVLVRTHRWLLIEWLTTFLLLWAWYTRDRTVRYQLVNIHIAYPLGMRTAMLKRIFKVPLVFTEQWSGYYFNFNTSSKGLDRIRRIFDHGVPLICVSQALLDDIERFSGIKQRRAATVDNVAETSFFHWTPECRPEEGRFFAIAGWNFPKRPDVLIDMMALLKATGMKARLHMAGNGLKIPAMKEAIARYGLENEVILLGHLSPDQVANELRSAHALLHCSDYETYSAVCAESLCMGTPVIASNVGGIVEYMTHDTGAMVQKNDPALWCEVVRGSWERTLQADRKAIAGYMHGRASTASVGARYHAALQKFMTDDPVASHDG